MLQGFFQRDFSPDIDHLRSDWTKLSTVVLREIVRGNLERAFCLLEELCRIGYTYNFVENYFDPNLDQLIKNVAGSIRRERFSFVPSSSRRILFFDYFTLDNRGFTQQYLDAFQASKAEIIYVMYEPKAGDERSAIVNAVERYEGGQVVALTSPTRVGKFEELLNLIRKYAPEKVFFHTAPWEVISSAVASLLQSTPAKGYLINITDHAFWPGISCFEYIIDFRYFGHYLNAHLKQKPKEKLIVIPTPAHIDTSTPFKGLPEIPSKSIVGFSGGSYYKIVDKSNTFLNLVRQTLLLNPTFVFLFANIGGEAALKAFIKEHSLEDRFYLIGNRQDINEVFKRVDIFFNTYPYAGGLMMQYALANGIPILSLADVRFPHSRIDLVFDQRLSSEHLIFSKNQYLERATKLINDSVFRGAHSSYYREVVVETGRFQERIGDLLADKPVPYDFVKDFEFDQTRIANFHIQNEGLQNRPYFLKVYRFWRHFPWTSRILVTLKFYFFRLLKR